MPEEEYGKADSSQFKDKSSSSSYLKNTIKNSKEKKSEDFEGKMNKEEASDYIKSGDIAKKVIAYTKSFVKKDMLALEIAEKIEGRIIELGGKIAFPVNISLNEVAAHYTPVLNDQTKVNGLLKIDIGIEVNGCIADCALSFDFSESGEFTEMIKFNEQILNNILKKLKIGSEVKEIGNSIFEEVETNGKYRIIKNLSGHSLDKNRIHAGLTIPNYSNDNSMSLENMAIAIEPFLTTGRGEIYEGRLSEIFVVESDKLPRDKDARKVLEFIKEEYKTKPFCKRWLEKKGFTKLNFILSSLSRDGILYNFPVLIEKDKKPVSQAEHTIVFADKVYVTTKE